MPCYNYNLLELTFFFLFFFNFVFEMERTINPRGNNHKLQLKRKS